jgi:acetoin utilization protein AcuB
MESSIIWLALPLALVVLVAWLSLSRRRASSPGLAATAAAPDSLSEPLGPNPAMRKRQRVLSMIDQDVDLLLTNRLQARHLMTVSVETVRPGDTVGQVRQLMRQARVRHVLVCDENRKLLGIISDRDVRSRSGNRAADILTPDPATICFAAPLTAVISEMLSRNVSCLPVLRGTELAGVVTTADILVAMHTAIEALETASARLGEESEPREAVACPA